SAAGAHTLAVNTSGTTTFTGIVGATALSSLSATNATGTVRLLNNVSTSGAGGQNYSGPVLLGNGAAATITVSAGTNNPVTFAKTVDAFTADIAALVVTTTGTTTFGGA